MTYFGSRPRAMMLALHILVLGAFAAPAPAAAMQILDAADHAELSAQISATQVNRIALAGDRIAKVVRAPDGFAVEHDARSGDLYLRPLTAEPAAPDRVTLFIGTEKGFTYRLTLTPADRDSAQILIRNGEALPNVATRNPGLRGQRAHRGAGSRGARGGKARVAAWLRHRDRKSSGRRRADADRDLAGSALRGARRRGRASGIRGCGRQRGPRRDHRRNS